MPTESNEIITRRQYSARAGRVCLRPAVILSFLKRSEEKYPRLLRSGQGRRQRVAAPAKPAAFPLRGLFTLCAGFTGMVALAGCRGRGRISIIIRYCSRISPTRNRTDAKAATRA